MPSLIRLDEKLGARLEEVFGDLPPEELSARLGALVDLALLRLDEATLLGLLEGRTSAALDEVTADVRYLEALVDRLLFYVVATYALARAPYDTEEARRIFQTSYEDARAQAGRFAPDLERRGSVPRC
jgi:hypothetical protein